MWATVDLIEFTLVCRGNATGNSKDEVVFL